MTEQNIISVSGGKDSAATLLLAVEREVENIRAVFMDTGNEHPLTYEYLDYLENAVGIKIERYAFDPSDLIQRRREAISTKWREDGIDEAVVSRALSDTYARGNPFLDLCVGKGIFPSRVKRFCTLDLKINVFKKNVLFPTLAKGIDITSWQGVRHDESRARSCLVEREFQTSDKVTGAESWIYRPILEWKAEDCFAMLKKHGVEPNPLYKLGMTRVGCMPCIYANKVEIAEISKRFPDQIDKIREWERIVSRCNQDGLACFFHRADGLVGIDAVVEWSRTDRGGRQMMFDIEIPSSCSSVYGLCE